MRHEHRCKDTKERKYEITSYGSVWMIYDKMQHGYLMYVKYCPFCGKELDDNLLGS